MESLSTIFNVVQNDPILSGLAILVLFALTQDFFLFRRLRRLVRGGDGKSLEATIRILSERVAVLESHARKTNEIITDIDERVTRSIQGVSVKRFDPFQNAGGQQSFATALVNEDGDGVVLSGIHARDGVRVYAKGLNKFSSERELSDDEKEAISSAKESLK